MSKTMCKRGMENGLETKLGEDFITIIAPSMAEVMDSFRAQGLAAKHYTIIHRAGRHSFTMAGEGAAHVLFEGLPMVAATFMRPAQA